MVSQEVAIGVRGVSHQFGEMGEQRFVRSLLDTSLAVSRGELLCLIGPSGCGKSTLLNVIGGLTQPSAGSVEVLGKPVRGPSPHDIAFVFQENALFPWNTVIENIELGMSSRACRNRNARAGRKRPSPRWGSLSSLPIIPPNCPAACASVRRSPARSRWRRRSC